MQRLAQPGGLFDQPAGEEDCALSEELNVERQVNGHCGEDGYLTGT